MNFGYPNTPFATNMMQEGYMGNAGNNPNMINMDYMQSQGCAMGQQYMAPGYMTQGGCGQVLQQTCAVDMPYYVNYNTHVVNNVVRRHIQIPVYTQTQQTVYFDEWQTGCGCNR